MGTRNQRRRKAAQRRHHNAQPDRVKSFFDDMTPGSYYADMGGQHRINVARAMPQWKAGGIRPDKRAVLAARGKSEARKVLKYAKAHKGRTGLAIAGAATAAAVVRSTGSGVDKGGRGRPTGMYGF